MYGKSALLFALSAFLIIGGSSSCEKRDSESGVLAVSVKNAEADYSSGSTFVIVTASGHWSLSLDFQGDAWASLETDSGGMETSGSGARAVVLHYEGNDTESSRTCTVSLVSGERKVSCSFVQNSRSSGSQEGGNGPIAARWLELPAMSSSDPFDYHTHFMSLDGRRFRNYSLAWNSRNFVAEWVAYPLNEWTIGTQNVGRQKTWFMDPAFSVDMQPDFIKGGIGTQGYDRGHQIPSADRQNEDSNVQTFYMTNVTPQLPDFNQKIWQNFESKVRAWASNSDTLYVVTGCITDGSNKTIRDNSGKNIAVPTAYFKALLRYSKASTLGVSGFMSAGFYLEHKSYSQSNVDKSMCMSIRELENRTGFDFFVNLEDKVGRDAYQKIEQQDPATVAWWWN